MIQALLEKHRDQFGNIFDFTITKENSVHLDLSKNNSLVTTDVIENAASQEAFVFSQIRNASARVGVGGYLENRKLYQRGSIYDNATNPRSVHLGIDLWIEARTQVYAPFEGVVFSVKNNEGVGDYGPTLIVKHQLEEQTFYTLYGHLSLDALNIKLGDQFSKGQKLCEIGNYPINGDWAPHLHFQILTNLDDFKDGDYPAVCTEMDLITFLSVCPNPNLILRIPTLD
jgi:peptidoglycan LD-endopeptidase LytH